MSGKNAIRVIEGRSGLPVFGSNAALIWGAIERPIKSGGVLLKRRIFSVEKLVNNQGCERAKLLMFKWPGANPQQSKNSAPSLELSQTPINGLKVEKMCFI